MTGRRLRRMRRGDSNEGRRIRRTGSAAGQARTAMDRRSGAFRKTRPRTESLQGRSRRWCQSGDPSGSAPAHQPHRPRLRRGIRRPRENSHVQHRSAIGGAHHVWNPHQPPQLPELPVQPLPPLPPLPLLPLPLSSALPRRSLSRRVLGARAGFRKVVLCTAHSPWTGPFAGTSSLRWPGRTSPFKTCTRACARRRRT